MMTREVSAPFGSYSYLSTCVDRKCGKKVAIDSNEVEWNFILGGPTVQTIEVAKKLAPTLTGHN